MGPGSEQVAVGCASSAAGGGRCGSGAVSGGLGESTTGFAEGLSNNVFVQSAVVGLGGGAGSALTGGSFGEGFFIAASGYLFNDCVHNVDCLNPQSRGPGMVDTYVGHGQWAWLPPGVAADAFTAAQFSDPSPEQAQWLDNASGQFAATAVGTGAAGLEPIAGFFLGTSALFRSAALLVNPPTVSLSRQLMDSALDVTTDKFAPGFGGQLGNTIIQQFVDPYFQKSGH